MSAEYEYLPVTHDELPVEKIFNIDGESYAFEFNYNDEFDFYTMIISAPSTGDVLFTTKLTYLNNALDAVAEGIKIIRKIIPAIPSDITAESPSDKQVNKDTFDEVRICLI